MIQCDHKVERIDYEGQSKIGVCVVCGRRRLYDSVGMEPPKVILEGVLWDKLGYQKKHAYFEQHREEMIQDYWSGKEGRRDGKDKLVREKWGILSGTWGELKKLWGLPVVSRTKDEVKPEDSPRLGDKPEKSKDRGHVVRIELGPELGKKVFDQAQRYYITPGSLVRMITAQWFERREQWET